MYRVSTDYLRGRHTDAKFNYQADENCLLWKKQTGSDASLEQIYRIVYKASVSEVEGSSRRDTNLFARTLCRDREAAEVLLLAKQCELARKEMNSPWYYPSKNDDKKMNLEAIADKAMGYTGKRFAGRYALQAERALLTLHRYDDCINYWNSVKGRVADDVIRKMTIRYVAGAYYNIGDVDTAKKLFLEAGDIDALMSCVEPEGSSYLVSLYENAPNCQELRDRVEHFIINAEISAWDTYSGESELEEDQITGLMEIHDLSLRIVREGRVKDPDLWYYNAAFVQHILGKDQRALDLLAKGEKAKGTPFIKESIRVMQIYLNAKDLPVDSSYESYVTGQLRWLDSKVVEHLDEARERTVKEGIYNTNINVSYFYWNDMIRKIVHGAVCPRLVDGKRFVSAIRFSNYADNRLFNLVGRISNWGDDEGTLKEYRNNPKERNCFDFRNRTFCLIDTIGVDNVIRYVASLDRPSSEGERFLDNGSYTERAYFHDIIGTQMIREMRYREAEQWLSKVPASYQKRLNVAVEGYLDTEPFLLEETKIRNTSDYKYAFAREMASLERDISATSDPDRKAMLMLRKGIGMKNSVTSCWALSFYGKNYDDDTPKWGKTYFYRKAAVVLNKADKLFAKAHSTAGDDETKARICYTLGYCRTVLDDYPETVTASFIRFHCDTYSDYHYEKRVPLR